MFNEEEYWVSPLVLIVTCVLTPSQYTHDKDGVEYPSTHEFYHRSNTHNPNEDGFEDLYHRDFIHAISQVACCKLAHHCLDPYQCAAFCYGIFCHNTGEEEADPTLELAMEYASALGMIVFDELCRLCDLTEAQVGRNQFTMDIAVDQLDNKIDEVNGRVDHTSERLSVLEGKMVDMEEGYNKLLALGREQMATSVRAYRAITALSTITMVQQEEVTALRVRVTQAEERIDVMWEMILALEHTQENPIVVDDEETAVSEEGELEVEENEVVIPILAPGRLGPIEDAVQVLPDELVGTQIMFELADEDRPPLYE